MAVFHQAGKGISLRGFVALLVVYEVVASNKVADPPALGQDAQYLAYPLCALRESWNQRLFEHGNFLDVITAEIRKAVVINIFN